MAGKDYSVFGTLENNENFLLYGHDESGKKVEFTQVLELASPTKGGANSRVTLLRYDESALFSRTRALPEFVFVKETGVEIFDKCIKASVAVSAYAFKKEAASRNDPRRTGIEPKTPKQ